ncbi:MAG TPA: hypothetical protein VIC62_13175, partial [Nakamurella sp.]
MSIRPTTATEPTGDPSEPTTNGPPVGRSPRPWLHTIAAVPHRRIWFTLAKVAFVTAASLLGFAAGAGARLGFALAAATCLVGVALVERLDIAIRDDELRQAELAQAQASQDREDAVTEYGQLVNYTLTPIADVVARMLVTPDRQVRRALFASVYTLAVKAL